MNEFLMFKNAQKIKLLLDLLFQKIKIVVLSVITFLSLSFLILMEHLQSISWKTNSLLASSLEIVVGFRVFAGISQSDQKAALAFLLSLCCRALHRSEKHVELMSRAERSHEEGASIEIVSELCYWQRRGNVRRCVGCGNHNGSYIVGHDVKPSFSSDLIELACAT